MTETNPFVSVSITLYDEDFERTHLSRLFPKSEDGEEDVYHVLSYALADALRGMDLPRLGQVLAKMIQHLDETENFQLPGPWREVEDIFVESATRVVEFWREFDSLPIGEACQIMESRQASEKANAKGGAK